MSAAIVTGAAGAIGRAIALRLAEEGHALLCVDRDLGVRALQAEIESLGGNAASCTVDLEHAETPAVICERAHQLGPVSVLVNNAGITRDARLLAMDREDFRQVISVNALAPLRLAIAISPHLGDGGSVVNISSRAAFGNFGQANYVAAKAALIGATRALALRWAPGVRVNSVAPGLVDTAMTQAMPAAVLHKLQGRIPAGRSAHPAEIAEIVGFLASPRASYVTGQTFVACGGRSLAG
jgi:NAD(P)-dependent dehydrogenase (short-subunit alcohol dehydrogenase family)